MKNQLLFLSLAGAVLLSGCSKDADALEGSNTPQGEFVSVTLPVQVADATVTPPSAMSQGAQGVAAVTAPGANTTTAALPEGFTVSFSEPATATGEANDATRVEAPSTRTIGQELTNVWVLQFDNTGKNVSTTNTGTLAAGAYLTAPSLQVGTGYTIYIVANGVASGLTTSNPATLTAFENEMLHTTAVTDATKLPMSGKLTDVTILNLGDGKGKISLPSSAPATVVMNRIQAEVTLTVDFGVTNYTLTGAELYNVPVGAVYGWNSATTTFPDNAVAANFGYTDLKAAGMASLTPTTSGTKTTFKWFTGDNRRGEVAGLTAQSDRNRTKAPAYATFARVTLTNSSLSTQKIYYDIYLGSGSVTNFDVKRNMTYTQTAAIKGSAAFHEALIGVDLRVSESPVLKVDQNGILTYKDKMLFFQFGSVVGFTQEGAWGADKVLFNPVTGSPSYATYTGIPVYAYNASQMNISASNYHNGTNIKAGKGDPCMLVGLTAEKIQLMTAAELDAYNSGWRLSTNADQQSFTGQTTNVNYTEHWVTSEPAYDKWYYSTGSAGGWFPNKSNRLRYLPAAGYRSYTDGSPTNVGVNGGYWSSTAYDSTNGYSLNFFSTWVHPLGYNRYTYGFGARCVR